MIAPRTQISTAGLWLTRDSYLIPENLGHPMLPSDVTLLVTVVHGQPILDFSFRGHLFLKNKYLLDMVYTGHALQSHLFGNWVLC